MLNPCRRTRLLLLVAISVAMIGPTRVAYAAGGSYETCMALVTALNLDPTTCAAAGKTQQTAPVPGQEAGGNALGLIASPAPATQAPIQVNTLPQMPDQAAPAMAAAPAMSPGAAIPQAPVRDYNVYFPKGSNILVDEYRGHLDLLVGVLRTRALSGTCLKLVGHSDSNGSFKANQELSLTRAQTVQTYLLDRLTGANIRILIEGKGEEEPLPGVAPENNRNRRVEIFAKRCS